MHALPVVVAVLVGLAACTEGGPSAAPATTAPALTQTPTPEPARVATLAIVGDLMLGRRVGEAIADDPAAPLRPTAKRLSAADLTIGTFEATLSRLGRPTQGDDSFSADPAVLEGLKLAGFDLFSLANNHVGDFGDRSLLDTVRRLRAAGFATVGAGADAAEARAPAVLEANGLRIGVLAFNAIGETPRAGPSRPGAVTLAMQPRLGNLNDGDLTAMTDAIRDLDADTDAVLVLPHWGDQYTPVAVPDQRRVARALVGAGADLVVGSHPHVVQGADSAPGPDGPGFIAYSLGNYVFDMDFSVPTQQGAILELDLGGRSAGRGGPVRRLRALPDRSGLRAASAEFGFGPGPRDPRPDPGQQRRDVHPTGPVSHSHTRRPTRSS